MQYAILNYNKGFKMNYFDHSWTTELMWLMPLLIIGLLFYLFQNKNNKQKSSAQDLLDRRYANGGIDEKEYNEKSKYLKEEK